MSEGPGDLSGRSVFISCLSSSGVNGAMNKGCVVVVAVEACSFILGRSLETSRAFSSSDDRVRVGVRKGDGLGRIESSAS